MRRRPLLWAYKRLGPRYPLSFLTVELLAAFPIAAGTLAIFSFYFDSLREQFVPLLILTMVLIAISIVYVLARTMPLLAAVSRWIGGDRSTGATANAWSAAVSLPVQTIRHAFGISVFAVDLPISIVAVVALDLHPAAFLLFFGGGLIAIGYAAMLHYLAVEIGMRPVLIDISRRMQTPPMTERPTLSLRFRLLATLPLINVITGVIVAALTTEGGGTAALGLNVLVALAVAFIISFELTVLFARSILHPIEDLEAATERIRQGRLAEHVPVTTGDELGELTTAFNQMIDGLAERERLREVLGTYLDEEVARYIVSHGYDPAGAEVEVSILFCDVTAFTKTAADAEAAEVVARLNELFEVIVPIIARHRGHVDQFIGDGLMAVFGAPERIPDHADRAVQCAVEIARTVNSRRPGGFTVGVGVNSGKVVAGSIGGAGRLSFSVIGDAVNLASRVEQATRDLGDPVLITSETRNQLSETIEVADRGTHELRGYDRMVKLYAPHVPVAVRPGVGGKETDDPLHTGAEPGLGKAVGAGLGKAPTPAESEVGLGKPGGGGSGRNHTLPG